MLRKICDFISKYMALIVIVVAATAVTVPASFNWISTSWITPLLGLVMFGMGLTMDPHDFKVVFTRPKDIIIGSLSQFIIMPLTAFLLTRAFGLGDELAIGVILVGCCPGGTASNVMTYMAKGDLALSVGMTTVSTVLAPVLTPLLTLLYAGARVHVDTLGMFLSIIEVVILPIILGFVFKKLFPKQAQSMTTYLPAFSSLMITLIVGIIVSANAQKLLTGGLLIVAVVMLHNICGLSMGYLVGHTLHLPHHKCSAISIEVGMQNSGLASSLATIHFAMYPMATVPGAIFSVWHNVSGAIIAKFYAWQQDRIEAKQ
jgi:BASS family bile acid:Na+ symporter